MQTKKQAAEERLVENNYDRDLAGTIDRAGDMAANDGHRLGDWNNVSVANVHGRELRPIGICVAAKCRRCGEQMVVIEMEQERQMWIGGDAMGKCPSGRAKGRTAC
jgi:hypothetical protein